MKSVYSVISNANLHHYPLNTKKYSFLLHKKVHLQEVLFYWVFFVGAETGFSNS